jgi:hypothetical protein
LASWLHRPPAGHLAHSTSPSSSRRGLPRPLGEGDEGLRARPLSGRDKGLRPRAHSVVGGRDEVRRRWSTPARWLTAGKTKTEAGVERPASASRASSSAGRQHLQRGRRAAGICDASVQRRGRRHLRRGRQAAACEAGVERRRHTGSGSKLLESPQRRLHGFLVHRC